MHEFDISQAFTAPLVDSALEVAEAPAENTLHV
jgi:hypothetical protein